jgi:hypothetical protein
MGTSEVQAFLTHLLHVKDLNFEYYQIAMRDTKGAHDRFTLLPASL